MNTKVEYLYRDADNYKENNEVIVSGEYTEDQKRAILKSLEESDGRGGYFIPEQIGLEIHRPGDEITDADHCYCELYEYDFYLTDKEPTDDRSITELTQDFIKVGRDGWDAAKYAPENYPFGIASILKNIM